jgi:hypothetical protein
MKKTKNMKKKKKRQKTALCDGDINYFDGLILPNFENYMCLNFMVLPSKNISYYYII